MNKVLQQLLKFRKDRDWNKYHTPQNIAQSIVLEAAEALEIFQWKPDNVELSEKDKVNLGEELADVYNWLLLLSHDIGIDLNEVALKKIKTNAKKYPITKSKGKATKYTELK